MSHVPGDYQGGHREGFGDHVLATAILDRLLHHATTLNIKGESYRLKDKRRAGLLGQQRAPGDDGRDGRDEREEEQAEDEVVTIRTDAALR